MLNLTLPRKAVKARGLSHVARPPPQSTLFPGNVRGGLVFQAAQQAREHYRIHQSGSAQPHILTMKPPKSPHPLTGEEAAPLKLQIQSNIRKETCKTESK